MILKRFIICLGVILVVTACNRAKAPEKPKNLISKDKMVDILIDSKIIASANSDNKKIMKDNGVNLDTYVFEKHNIDSLQFALSNNYYAFHIKDYEAIYEKVNDSLEALKVNFKDLEAKEWKEQTKREEDSLKSVLKVKDTLKILTIKDSINLIEIEDALKEIEIVDSLTESLIEKKIEQKKGLIKPISDKEFQ